MNKYVVTNSKTLETVAFKTLKEARKKCREFNKDRVNRFIGDKDQEWPATIYPIDLFMAIIIESEDLKPIKNLETKGTGYTVFGDGKEITLNLI